ncbi:MAG: hypothetical protein KIT79_15365 [Deltaproteobacteria bacterium]|nr:hypothetical protein [Deltaproteobacteria bacterium]
MDFTQQYPKWFVDEFERIRAKHGARKIIQPSFHPAAFTDLTGTFTAASEHSTVVTIPQKEIFVLFGFRYATTDMERMLQYPFRMKVSDPSRQEALLPSYVFAPSVCSTAAFFSPLMVPVELPGSSILKIDIKMPEGLPGGNEYIPEIVLCGVSLLEGLL